MPDTLLDAVAIALINLAHYAGLTIAIGAVTMRVLVLSRCGLAISERAPHVREAARAGGWGAALILAAAPLRALNQVRTLVDPDEAWLPVLQGVLGTSLGKALMLQAVWAAAAGMAFLAVRPGHDRGWKIASIALAILALTPGLAGHAATAASPALALAAATTHVLGAGVWIGGLFHLWRLSGPASALTLRRALGAFHPVAMTGVALMIVSGSHHVWTTLGPLANLAGTPWGRLLSLKLVLVTAVLALGYKHWRSSERAVEAGDRSGLRQSIGHEALLALVVLVVTAVLTSTGKPL